jgi:GrpB-like predicted nucleotidyltransferase (UPF0157 family)
VDLRPGGSTYDLGVQPQPVVYLISGPPTAGTSSVARLLAARFERGVHLDAAGFRQSIVRGGEHTAPGAISLCQRLAAAATDTYVEAGFTVALEDAVRGPALGEYRTMIRSRPCHIIVLLPPGEAVPAETRAGIWLDTAQLTPEQTVDEILAQTAADQEPVVIAEYDEGWPARFEQLAQPVRDQLAGIAGSVEHVGSTAVPGLAAKPIIDIDVVVHSAGDVPAAIERLRGLGYVYQGDKGIRGREAFLWPRGAPRHHLYVVVEDTQPHTDHVRFRDYLRRHPDVAAEYAALKIELAARYGDDRLGYTTAKTAFIAEVMRAADG